MEVPQNITEIVQIHEFFVTKIMNLHFIVGEKLCEIRIQKQLVPGWSYPDD